MSVSKIVAAAASSAGGAGLDVDEVFSTFLYDGTGSAQTITNGIDLSGEGGLVWIKERTDNEGHRLIDTVRGNTKMLRSDATGANYTIDGGFDNFTSTGFTLKADNGWSINTSSEDYVSWTFRKAPKFFDVVTYTGNGPTGSSSDTPQTISHNLGSIPALIIVKKTSGSSQWLTFHRSIGSSKYLKLNATSAQTDSTDGGAWATYDPTSTDFKVGFQINDNGATYVAYLFAHNNNDGGFGPDGDQDIIKCGSFTANSSGAGLVGPDLGFEPQWVLLKNATSTGSGNWWLFDSMRGFTATGGGTAYLQADTNGAEGTFGGATLNITSNGFTMPSNAFADGQTFIYMAIRRGPLAAPDDATKVFAIDQENSSAPYFTSGFPVDFAIAKWHNATQAWRAYSRLTQGKELYPNETGAEGVEADAVFDYMDGHYSASQNSGYYSWMWKRAPSYFDVVATVTSSAQINHNLGVTPELAFYFNRSGDNIQVFAPTDGGLFLNSDARSFGYGNGSYIDKSFGANATATTVSSGGGALGNNQNVLIYLFASLSGVSKIGGVVHSGTTNVDAGFSSGSRFVLVKRVDGVGDWLTWDGTRGIVSGNDPYLALNSTAAEVTNTDYIDPYSAGFTLTSNLTSGTYLYYAIA
jgi:hypothetical protein